MRVPDPKANTTTEAYLAYKAGYLEESELKPVLYEPYLHFDGWLAYWAGLTNTYPVKNVGKNLFDKNTVTLYNGYFGAGAVIRGDDISDLTKGTNRFFYIPCEPNTTYTITKPVQATTSRNRFRIGTQSSLNIADFAPLNDFWNAGDGSATTTHTITTGANAKYLFVYFANATTATNPGGEVQDVLDGIQIEKGSTATSYEPYSGEPEMLCDEEALVAYLSGVTDTYPEEIKDPYDVRIVGCLKHLVSIRWPEPDYPVNNEEFYLSTMKPAFIPSGDPSSDIEIDGTAEGPFIDLKMYGDTYQKSYSGWQMLGGQGMATPFSDTTYWDTTSGFTQTPIEDGWATLSNTSGGTMQFANCFIKTQSQFQASTTYTVVIELANVESPGPKRMAFANPSNTTDSVASYNYISCPAGITEQTDGATWYSATGLVEGEYVLSFTTKSTLATFLPRLFFMYPSADKTFDMRMSIIEGDHSSDWQNYAGDNWQPYVGGIPAPNPDYPQAVQTVTGRQVVTVTSGDEDAEYEINLGKNLFAMPSSQTVNGVTMTVHDDGTFDLNGTASATGGFHVIKPLSETNLISGDTYTLHIPQDMQWRLPIFVQSCQADGTYSKQLITGGLQIGTSKTVVLENPNTQYVNFIFQVINGTTYNLHNFYIQLEQGSTATPYAPYFTPIELCNIGDYQDYIYNSGDDWYVHKDISNYQLTGDENWQRHSSGAFYDWGNSYAANGGKVPANDNTLPNIVSEYFTQGTQNQVFKNRAPGVCVASDNTSNPRFYVNGISTTEDFKGMITAKQPVLYFPLATPTDTKITDATLISQLDALMEGGSYEGKTYIKVTATDPNLPGLLYVEAGKYD